MLEEIERAATVKLTSCRWLQRRQRTGYRMRRISVRSCDRRLERRKLWPEQYWHRIGAPFSWSTPKSGSRSWEERRLRRELSLLSVLIFIFNFYCLREGVGGRRVFAEFDARRWACAGRGWGERWGELAIWRAGSGGRGDPCAVFGAGVSRRQGWCLRWSGPAGALDV